MFTYTHKMCTGYKEARMFIIAGKWKKGKQTFLRLWRVGHENEFESGLKNRDMLNFCLFRFVAITVRGERRRSENRSGMLLLI